MVTLPSIEVVFKQLATSLIDRSERGIGILIIKDDTDKTFSYKEYTNIPDVDKDKTLYDAVNLQYIKDVLTFALNKVCVVRIDATGGLLADALSIVEKNVKTGWITIADGIADDFTALASWIKAKEALEKSYKAVCYNVTAPDCRHIVNFVNTKVTFNDSRAEQNGVTYCPSLIGILAACNIQRGSTNFECSNLLKVTEVADNEAAVEAGKFILINDVDKVVIAEGINSLQTTNASTLTEDMQYIETVEAMDLISDDISNVFKNEYLGKYKNKYDNQVMFISAINSYFDSLANDVPVLDNEYDNNADVDVDAQRNAWLGIGKTEANTWTEQQVKNNAFKRSVFLSGDIKILGSMENLTFNVLLF